MARKSYFLRRRFHVENALVDVNDGVDKRHFHVEAWLGDDTNRLAQPHYQCLLGLAHGEQGAVADDDGDQKDDGDGAAGKTGSHWLPPADGVAGLRGCGRG